MRRHIARTSALALGLGALLMLGPEGAVPRSHAKTFGLADFQGEYIGLTSGAAGEGALVQVFLDGAGGGVIAFLRLGVGASEGITYFVEAANGLIEIYTINTPVLVFRGLPVDKQFQVHGVLGDPGFFGDGLQRTVVLVRR